MMMSGKLISLILVLSSLSVTAEPPSPQCDAAEEGDCGAEDAAVSLLQKDLEHQHRAVEVDASGAVSDTEEHEEDTVSDFSEYEGGKPGEKWTEEEALAVYTKLRLMTANPAQMTKRTKVLERTECYTENDIPFDEIQLGSDSECAAACQEQKERCRSHVYDQASKKCTLQQAQLCSQVKNWAPHMGSDPTMPMILRLGFHSCVPYEDGTGGCDGCVSTDDMFVRFLKGKNGKAPKIRPAEKKGSNGNMGPLLDLLEMIYTDPAFPPGSPRLKKSLKDSGKTRADLYAFAALAAAHWGMTNSNNACATHSHIYSKMQVPFECNITLSRPFMFKSGRKDCVKKEVKPWTCDEAACEGWQPVFKIQGAKNGFYKNRMSKKCLLEKCRGCTKCLPPWDGSIRPRAWASEKSQKIPPSWFNGKMLSDFFKDNFGFSKKDTVAIMGAHGIGTFHPDTNGGLRYMWTHSQDNQLNNLYYRVISLAPSYHFEIGTVPGSRVNVPATILGGVSNKPARSRLFLHKGGEEVNGGVFQWFHQYERCPLCKDGKVVDYKLSSYSHNGQRGDVCCSLCQKATAASTKMDSLRVVLENVEGLSASESKQFKDFNCLQFISTHETFITADVGLHRALEIGKGGRPLNCAMDIGQPCPLNELQDPGEKKMHEIVDMYTENQNKWADDFVDVMERMLETGVDSTLTNSFSFGLMGAVVCDRSSGPFLCRKMIPDP